MTAILWLRPEDCKEVEIIDPQIIYASTYTHYYVLHPSVPVYDWLPVDEFATGEGWENQISPFDDECFEAGDSTPIDDEIDDEEMALVERYLEHTGHRWEDLRLYGYIHTRDEGWIPVRSGDWIIKEGAVCTSVVKDDQPTHKNG